MMIPKERRKKKVGEGGEQERNNLKENLKKQYHCFTPSPKHLQSPPLRLGKGEHKHTRKQMQCFQQFGAASFDARGL